MELFDSHSHYNDEKFDIDRVEIIKKTKDSGVTNFIIAGYNIESSKRAMYIAKENEGAYAIIGISPNDLDGILSTLDMENAVKEIEKIYILNKAENIDTKIVGIGEIGLDYYWSKENKEFQKEMFIRQINLANKYNLPIIIHTREATEDTINILKNNVVAKRGIFHCCPLNSYLVTEALKLGYYISLSGVITFKNAKNADEIIKIIPEERLLIETDSPYLAPEPVRGTRNNSINVKYVAQKIASVKNKSVEEIAELTTRNAKRIFEI